METDCSFSPFYYFASCCSASLHWTLSFPIRSLGVSHIPRQSNYGYGYQESTCKMKSTGHVFLDFAIHLTKCKDIILMMGYHVMLGYVPAYCTPFSSQ